MKKKPSHPLSKHVRVALPVFILMAIAGVYLLVTPFGIAWGGKPVSGGATSAAISNVKSANITFASAAFTFDTDVPALGKVCYSTDSRLRTYTCRFDIVGTPHTVLADFLSPNTTYYYDAEASVGTITTKSPIQSFKTLPSPSPADKTAPSESITTPVAGSTVSGVIPVNVTAQDAGGITQVEIVLDIAGAGIRFPADILPPYSFQLDTTKYTDGNHTLSTIAVDPAGNGVWSSPITVHIQNTQPIDSTSPSVPTGLSSTGVSDSQINLTWSASSDAVGVTGYKLYRNNSLVRNVTTTSTLDSGLTPSTQYTYTVAAYDAAGNLSMQSAPTTIGTLIGTSTATTTP